MPVSQDSSFINDYSKVKEQVIMVIEYLQQIKDSYFEQKHALEKIESSEDNLLDSMKNILNRVELCSQLIDIDPVRCRLELSSIMKILTDLIEEKDESDF